MTDIFLRFFRTVLFLLLAAVGVTLALVLLIATGITVAIFYAVATVYSKRFGARGRQGCTAGPGWVQKSSLRPKQKTKDVIDVEVRELR